MKGEGLIDRRAVFTGGRRGNEDWSFLRLDFFGSDWQVRARSAPSRSSISPECAPVSNLAQLDVFFDSPFAYLTVPCRPSLGEIVRSHLVGLC